MLKVLRRDQEPCANFQGAILLYKVNPAIDRWTKPSSSGCKPCHQTKMNKAMVYSTLLCGQWRGLLPDSLMENGRFVPTLLYAMQNA